jgi:tetratricopeptide (TPR) repeat protein
LGYGTLGQALAQCGRSDEAIAMLDVAARLDPKGEYWRNYASAHFSAGRYEEAARCLDLETVRNESLNNIVLRIATYAHIGRDADSQSALDALMLRAPWLSVRRIESYATRMAPGYVDRLVGGLRKAGMC